jgi:hypothetical protein
MAHGATVWLSDSLIESCLRFYQIFFILFVNIREVWHSSYFTRTIIILLFHQSNTNSCLNPNGSGLWYADHLNSKRIRDCLEGDAGVTCGGLAKGDPIYSDRKSCCESELSWRFPKLCEVSHQELLDNPYEYGSARHADFTFYTTSTGRIICELLLCRGWTILPQRWCRK